VELQKCLFEEKKQTKVAIVKFCLVLAKNLKNVINVTHTLFFSSEKELSKPTKFRIKLNISPLTPISFYLKTVHITSHPFFVRIGIKTV